MVLGWERHKGTSSPHACHIAEPAGPWCAWGHSRPRGGGPGLHPSTSGESTTGDLSGGQRHIRSYPREPPDSRNQARPLLAAVQEVRPFLGVCLMGQRSEGQIVTRDDKPDERRLPKQKRCVVPQWHHLPAWTPPRRVTVFPHSVRLYSNIS